MTQENTEERPVRPGRLFVVLWAFTLLIELISLQTRLAIFGGTGWLTYIKFTSLSDRLGFIAILSMLCAALCGIWTALFIGIGKKIKAAPEKIARWCATSWIVVLAVDLIFRHKIGELLGSAFNFFEFATGVGGVWHMLEQAFQWYGDVILLSIVGIAVLAAATWFFFRWFFKPRERLSALDKLPKPILVTIILFSLIFGLLFMSVMAPQFPTTHKLLASETMFGATFNVLVNVSSDFDGDGYGAFDLPPDEMPFDASMHPHALDTPDDGTDQDLLLGDLQIADVPQTTRAYIEAQGSKNDMSYLDRRHVIVVLMESVRHDMLDATIDGNPVMPELNALIQRGGIRVDGAFATRGFTQNSVTQTFWGSFFDPGHSLVDDFKTLGYHTAAFSGESLLDEGFDESAGWNRAGDTVVDPRNIAANVHHHQSVPARVLMDEVETFLDGYDPNDPLFMYVFYQDPHFPYQQDNPPVFTDRDIKRTEIAVETRPRLWRTYANQVHHLDMAAGRLVAALDKKKMLDNALVIFISDHGESLFDDGYLLGHGIAIGDLMTHAAMVVYGAKHDIPELISHPDIRNFIHQDLRSNQSEPKIRHTSRPVMQFIGATTVPSAISHRYADGSRVTYEFASRTAWREGFEASFEGQQQRLVIAPHDNVPVDTRITASSAIKESGRWWSPIKEPLKDAQIQALIREWEYMQWYHRADK